MSDPITIPLRPKHLYAPPGAKLNRRPRSSARPAGMDGKVMPCRCAHAYQDKIHGKGLRYHNPRQSYPKGIGKPGASNVKIRGFRCTVCGDSKDAT